MFLIVCKVNADSHGSNLPMPPVSPVPYLQDMSTGTLKRKCSSGEDQQPQPESKMKCSSGEVQQLHPESSEKIRKQRFCTFCASPVEDGDEKCPICRKVTLMFRFASSDAFTTSGNLSTSPPHKILECVKTLIKYNEELPDSPRKQQVRDIATFLVIKMGQCELSELLTEGFFLTKELLARFNCNDTVWLGFCQVCGDFTRLENMLRIFNITPRMTILCNECIRETLLQPAYWTFLRSTEWVSIHNGVLRAMNFNADRNTFTLKLPRIAGYAEYNVVLPESNHSMWSVSSTQIHMWFCLDPGLDYINAENVRTWKMIMPIMGAQDPCITVQCVLNGADERIQMDNPMRFVPIRDVLMTSYNEQQYKALYEISVRLEKGSWSFTHE